MSIWSNIEVSVGMICANTPGIASLLRHVWPSFLGSTDNSNKYTPSGPNSNGNRSGSGNYANRSKAMGNSVSVSVTASQKLTSRGSDDDDMELVERDPSARRNGDW